MFISHRTVILKKKFLEKETNTNKIELDEVYKVQEPAHTESNLIGESNSKPVEAPLRRFDIVLRQLDKYYNFFDPRW